MKYLKLMRIKHYLKNVLIFLPAFFGGILFNDDVLLKLLVMFISFSLTSSIIYIINDINDRESDKKHPIKCKRPIASGKVSVIDATILAVLLFFIVLVLLYSFDLLFNPGTLLLLLYFVLNIGYSFGLKNIPLLDIIILVSGFVIRVLYGGISLDITLSNWLILTILTISFYLSLGKRRNEIQKNGSNSREVLKYYNKEFLDKNMYMFLAVTIVFYSLWAVDVNTIINTSNLLIWTVPIVMIIMMKYSMDIEGNSYGDPIEVISHDKILMLLGTIYVIVLISLIYLG